MSFSPAIKETLTTADAKAIATNGPAGINAVPVSMIKVEDRTVWLFDFFMDKTAQNVQAIPEVALTAWSGMTGIQMKATVNYVTEGDEFQAAVDWVATQNPDRVVKGLMVLTPTELFDISPGGAFAAEELEF